MRVQIGVDCHNYVGINFGCDRVPMGVVDAIPTRVRLVVEDEIAVIVLMAERVLHGEGDRGG